MTITDERIHFDHLDIRSNAKSKELRGYPQRMPARRIGKTKWGKRNGQNKQAWTTRLARLGTFAVASLHCSVVRISAWNGPAPKLGPRRRSSRAGRRPRLTKDI
ncbi:hypothetical protein [Arthrobacter bambusae]|uniref:hypothetical protein n=1 Tax=Arthrobacter bambusae TaxID=1338426 RepID=UPI002788549E|nr:hypothetical protein [Arthrobacter bambusae]MDQ0030151.1 hypothetical protein [Arthrobacter bambusae]